MKKQTDIGFANATGNKLKKKTDFKSNTVTVFCIKQHCSVPEGQVKGSNRVSK